MLFLLAFSAIKSNFFKSFSSKLNVTPRSEFFSGPFVVMNLNWSFLIVDKTPFSLWFIVTIWGLSKLVVNLLNLPEVVTLFKGVEVDKFCTVILEAIFLIKFGIFFLEIVEVAEGMSVTFTIFETLFVFANFV